MVSAQGIENMLRIPNDVFSRGQLDVVDEVVQPDYREHVPLPPGVPAGSAGLKQLVAAVRTGFPDFRYTVDDVISEDDKVVLRVTAHGTHLGDLFGTPPTGKQASWSEIHIARVDGDKLAEHWAVYDQLGMLQQLGVIPAPGAHGG